MDVVKIIYTNPTIGTSKEMKKQLKYAPAKDTAPRYNSAQKQ